MTGDESITALLTQWRQGNDAALEALTPLVYTNLRRIARKHIAGEAAGNSLCPTELVHEAFLRLVGAEVPWQDRAHFLAVAARQMRRILVEHARAHGRQKRGGSEWQRVTLTGEVVDGAGDQVDIVAVHEALEQLAAFDPRKAEIIDLVLFGGMTAKEAAEVLQVSEPTLNRELRMARVWLRHHLQDKSE